MNEPCLPQRLVDYFVVVGVGESLIALDEQPASTNLYDCRFKPFVIDRFPEADYDDAPLPPAVSMFCLPEGALLHRLPPMPAIFSFVLTGGDGARYYGVSLTFYERLKPRVTAAWRAEVAGSGDADEVGQGSVTVLKSLSDDEVFAESGDTKTEDTDENTEKAAVWDDATVPGNRPRASTIEALASSFAKFEVMARRAADQKVRRDSQRSMELLFHPNDDCYAPRAICLISHWPFFDVFRFFLSQLYRVVLSTSSLPIERFIGNFLLEVPLPPPGKVTVSYSFAGQSVAFSRPPVNDLPLTNFSFEPMFQCLDHKIILSVLMAVLLEMKVLLVSSRSSLLTTVAMSLTTLMFPFRWEHVFIPVLPFQIIGFIQAPLPFLIGCNSSYLTEAHIAGQEVVVVDLDHGTLQLPRPLPALPERKTAKLLAKLEKVANCYVPDHPALVNLDTAFPNAPLPEEVDDAPENGASHHVYDQRAVQEGFLRYFVSMFKNYQDFIVLDTGKKRKATMFDSEAFLRSHKRRREFMAMFLQTQAWDRFIERRIYHSVDDFEVLFFDESIDAKLNRSLRMIRKKKILFLEDRRQAHKEMFVAPTADSSGMKKAVWRYDQFPTLRPELFSPARYVRPLVEEYSEDITMAAVSSLARQHGIVGKRHTASEGKNKEGQLRRVQDMVYGTWFTTFSMFGSQKQGEQQCVAFEILKRMRTEAESGVISCNDAADFTLAAFRAFIDAGFQKDAITYSSLIHVLSMNGDLPRAFQMLAEMKSFGFVANTMTYNSLVIGCGKAGLLDHALKLLTEMKKAKVTPDKTTFHAVIEGCVRCCNLECALEMCREMKARAFRPDWVTYTSLLQAHQQHGDLPGALRTLADMRTAGFAPNNVVYALLIATCGEAKQLHAAFNLEEEMGIVGLLPDEAVYVALIHACGSCGEYAKAREIFNSMKANDMRPGTLAHNALLRAYAINGHIEAAFRLYNDMKNGIARAMPNGSTFAQLIKGCAVAGKLDRAFTSLEEFKSRGEGEDKQEKMNVYADLITACGECGDTDRALRTFNEMKLFVCSANALSYNALIEAYCLKADLESALNYLAEMKANDINPDAVTFSHLTMACGVGRCMDQLSEIHGKMISSSVTPNVVVYNALIRACSRCGMPEAAMDALMEMKEKGILPNFNTYAGLVEANALNHRTEDALRVLEDMRSVGFQPNTDVYWHLMLGACEDSLMSVASDMSVEIKLHTYGTVDIGMYVTLIIAFVTKFDKPQKALEMMRDMVSQDLKIDETAREHLEEKFKYHPMSHELIVTLNTVSCLPTRDVCALEASVLPPSQTMTKAQRRRATLENILQSFCVSLDDRCPRCHRYLVGGTVLKSMERLSPLSRGEEDTLEPPPTKQSNFSQYYRHIECTYCYTNFVPRFGVSRRANPGHPLLGTTLRAPYMPPWAVESVIGGYKDDSGNLPDHLEESNCGLYWNAFLYAADLIPLPGGRHIAEKPLSDETLDALFPFSRVPLYPSLSQGQLKPNLVAPSPRQRSLENMRRAAKMGKDAFIPPPPPKPTPHRPSRLPPPPPPKSSPKATYDAVQGVNDLL